MLQGEYLLECGANERVQAIGVAVVEPPCYAIIGKVIVGYECGGDIASVLVAY